MLRIWDSNGVEVDLSSYGLSGLRLIIPAPSYNVEREQIQGKSGILTLNRDLQPRPLVAEFMLAGDGYVDSLEIRDEVYSLFALGSGFLIGETKQHGKRWYVECTDEWVPERINSQTFIISVPLLAVKGYAESTNSVEYKYTSNFALNNIGNKEINMCEQTDMEIEFNGASNNLIIRNKTTGDEWSYTGSTTAEDTILLKGVRSTKNGQSIFKDTNKKLLTFAPGWNDIEIEGSTDYTVTIRTRFYYI